MPTETEQVEKLCNLLRRLDGAIVFQLHAECEAVLQDIEEFLLSAPHSGTCVDYLREAFADVPSMYSACTYQCMDLLGLKGEVGKRRVLNRERLTKAESSQMAGLFDDVARRLRRAVP